MEYKEVAGKNGQILIFCKFEDLLKEAYGVSTMDEVEAHKNTSNGEYICHCPFCKAAGHRKHKLYIKDDLTVGHCFVCTRAFINVTDNIELTVQSPNYDNFGMNTGGKVNLVRLTDPNWTLDKYFNELDLSSRFVFINTPIVNIEKKSNDRAYGNDKLRVHTDEPLIDQTGNKHSDVWAPGRRIALVIGDPKV